MKKFAKRFLLTLLAAVLVVMGSLNVSAADGNVTYNGNSGQYIFTPGSEYSPTDLFPDFKDVMPGDQLHQRILISNDQSKNVKIKVYMRSLGAQPDSQEFLSMLSLTVSQVPGAVLFEAPADQTAQLTDWVYLGLIYSGGSVELDVKLDVPTSLDNTDKQLIGYLDWEFMIEELPVEPTDPEPPKTGDDFEFGWVLFAFIASGVAILLLLVMRRKKNKGQA